MSLFQIQVRGRDWTSFYEQVPKEILPTEYGGEVGSVAEHWGRADCDFFLSLENLETLLRTGNAFSKNNYKYK